ncbi:MAG: hypothetical protein ACTSU2_15470 [Promethearchaeota archaeon]
MDKKYIKSNIFFLGDWRQFFILGNFFMQILTLSYIAIVYILSTARIGYFWEASIIIGGLIFIIYSLGVVLYANHKLDARISENNDSLEGKIGFLKRLADFTILLVNLLSLIVYVTFIIIIFAINAENNQQILVFFLVINLFLAIGSFSAYLKDFIDFIRSRLRVSKSLIINYKNATDKLNDIDVKEGAKNKEDTNSLKHAGNERTKSKSKRRKKFYLIKRKPVTIFLIIFISEFGVIAPLWANNFYDTTRIDPADLDFSNFKISFWGGVGPTNYLSLNESVLKALGSSGLNSSFYGTIPINYFTNESLIWTLKNMSEYLKDYNISFIPHPPVGDFPDDYNSPIWIGNDYKIISAIESHNLSNLIKGLVVDVERSHRYRADMKNFANNSGLVAFLARYLGEDTAKTIGYGFYGISAENQSFHEEVVKNITNLIAYAHDHLGRNFEMILTCQGAGLYDLADGDDDVQLYEQYSTFPPEWDINSWMFYTWSTYSQDRFYKLAQNVRAQVSLFPPDKSRVLLGEVGKLAYSGNEGWDNLLKDIYICRYFGIKEVILYSYSYFISEFGYEGLYNLASALRNKTGDINEFEFSADYSLSVSALGTILGDIIFNLGHISGGGLIVLALGIVLLSEEIKIIAEKRKYLHSN